MIDEIINYPSVKSTIKNLFKNQEIEIVTRPASYIIKLKNEKENKLIRIIILPPKGHTSNKIDETSPHPETRKATILIKGGIRKNNQNFSVIKNAIKFSYCVKRNTAIIDNYPYAPINKIDPYYKEEIKSAREKFHVVEENGMGFYHNLINLSSDWILLILEKELTIQKEMNINSKIKVLPKDKQEMIKSFIEKVRNIGDNIFDEDENLINKILKLNIDEIIPVLIEALNIPETGKHEQCTIYAIILKLGKINKKLTKDYLQEALNKKEAQPYYLNELLQKLK